MLYRILAFSLLTLFILLAKTTKAQIYSIETLLISDHDGDGIPDDIDLDDDNDGIPDAIELLAANLDADGDGVPNIWDLDSDNDGIPDAVEAGFDDINGDGIADFFVDNNADGLHDALAGKCVIIDPDHDGLPNWIDLDSDNNGIPDVWVFGGLDENYDGRLDNFRDSDGDGLHDKVDGDIGNMLASGDVSLTATSHHALHLQAPLSAFLRYQTPTRLLRFCPDRDADGFCDDFDGDPDNELRPGQDFVLEDL